MIERVVHPYNLQKAVEQVVSNKGSAGVDGIKTSQLKALFPQRKDQLLEAIRQGNYHPQAILGVERFPKATEKPDYWVFPPPPTECCNKPYRRLSHRYLNPNLATIVLDLDLTKTPDKLLDKLGNTSIKG